MANSSIIDSAKNKIIKEFIKDTEIIQGIASTTVNSNTPEKLIGTHIFNYHQNPNTINHVGTFITLQVHIPSSLNSQKTFVYPTIEIWIISHENHMIVDNVSKITANRNDYLSILIDMKLNGRDDFGIGELELTYNVEGTYQQHYLFRKMVFQGQDVNDSLCSDE